MREREFATWLSGWYRGRSGAALDRASAGSYLSTARRLDAVHDLDQHWCKDRGRILLGKLRYSRQQAGRGIPPRHGIRIEGDPYTVTAAMRRAAVLYFEFCVAWPKGEPAPAGEAPPAAVPIPQTSTTRGSGKWPSWPEPGDEDLLVLARAVARHARFIHPDVVAAITEDNERHRAEWCPALRERRVDPAAYLWPRSPCAFPGVRRYAGSREIAEFHGHRQATGTLVGALALDDNTYPKHVWSWILRGRPFQQFGPVGYALAHLADHKVFGNRAEEELGQRGAGSEATLFGLFTCPTNTAYVPTSLLRPTDHARPIRNLLLRRAQALYGAVADLYPKSCVVPGPATPTWGLDRFEWADPVGSPEFLDAFLAFRREEMGRLMAGDASTRSPRRRPAGPSEDSAS